MSIEEQLRRSLSERASAVRTTPDEIDLARRISGSYRAVDRSQRVLRVAAIVVVAASAGGVVGAFANRGSPAVQVQTAAEHPGSSGTHDGTDHARGAGSKRGGGGAPTTTSPTAFAYSTAPQRLVTADGLTVNWAVTTAASPMAVPLAADQYACVQPKIVSLTISGGAPLASGTGVIGLPGVAPDGLAFVSSGAFQSSAKTSGWWTILETGNDISDVAVEFPWGEIEHVSSGADGGVAVVAGVAPSGYEPSSGSAFASAVAEDSSGRSQSSIGFYLGGATVVSGEATPAGGNCRPAATFSSSLSGGQQQAESTPADPVVAAGNVVQAFEQAYTINPIFGMAANLSAVAFGPGEGCSVVLPAQGQKVHADSVSLPDATVYAVAFPTPEKALVVYKLSGELTETGTAVLQGGSWKVSQGTYCSDMRS